MFLKEIDWCINFLVGRNLMRGIGVGGINRKQRKKRIGFQRDGERERKKEVGKNK